jgi:Transposase IS66 family
MFAWGHRVREGTLKHAIFRSSMTPVRQEVERLLEKGRRCDVPTTAGTCRDILKRRTALWTFVQGAGVEPTNNAAERSIRPEVLWRKGSFGTHSEAGSRFVESMLTVVSTLKQQGIRLKRDSMVSVLYPEELNATTSSVTLQSTDRHGILGQKPADFQLSLYPR